MVNLFTAEILSIQKHTDRLRSFEISIPKEINWDFLPGQYVDLALTDQPNKFSGFSLTSTPDQKSKFSITVQKTLEINASHKIFDLKTGDKVNIRGPAGTFILDVASEHEIVLIAGGIGVTPLISMFRTANANPLIKQAILFHSAKKSSELIFHDELKKIANFKPKLVYYEAVTQDQNWSGKRTRFTVQEIVKTIDSKRINEFHFFICGPGSMNVDFKNGLLSKGINPNNIHIESYYEP